MPTVTQGDIFELVVKATLLSQTILNRLHFGARNAFFVPSEGQDEIQVLADDWKETIRGRMHTSASFTTWAARQRRGAGVSYVMSGANQGDQIGGWVAEGNLTGTLTGGSGTTEVLPLQSAKLISWRSGFSGRRKRGRTFLGGFAEGEQSGGTVEASAHTAFLATLNTFFDKYKFGGTSTEFALGIWSDRTATGKKPVFNSQTGSGVLTPFDTPDPANAWVEAASFALSTLIVTQRRRRLGVGQ